jgi:hypothetical protein
VQKRVASDPAFGEALLREDIDSVLAGDVDTGKAILRDYIKATVGFEKLGEATGSVYSDPSAWRTESGYRLSASRDVQLRAIFLKQRSPLNRKHGKRQITARRNGSGRATAWSQAGLNPLWLRLAGPCAAFLFPRQVQSTDGQLYPK